MKHAPRFVVTAMALLLASSSANGGIVLGIADSNIGSSINDQFFTNCFSGDDVYGRTAASQWTLTNWSSRIGINGGNFSSGALTAAALIGKEWVVTSTNVAFSGAELATLLAFESGGGNVVVIGEGPIYNTINNNANAILGAVGSSMTFTVGGVASTGTPVIGVDPLTAGVTSFNGGYIGSISGGKALVTYNNSQVAVAVESAVPEPTSLVLWSGLGIMGLIAVRRRRKQAA